MDDNDDLPRRVPRKLFKARNPTRSPSTHVPERFNDGDDADVDVAAPRGKDARYLNQSIFSMVAAAGSKADFHSRFDEETSESESEIKTPTRNDKSMFGTQEAKGKQGGTRSSFGEKSKHIRKISGSKMRLPFSKLRVKTSEGKVTEIADGSLPGDNLAIEPLSPISPTSGPLPRDAPVMSRMLEAQAQFHSISLGSKTVKHENLSDSTTTETTPTTLSKRLMEIFGFDHPENVVSEYPCWLMQSVLLQGYMYITQMHVCFYAYLPKKSHVVAKSGYISKRGRQNPKYNRYWFVLKGDVLSYYADPSNLYFPAGNIDLRYGISASLSDQKNKDCTGFIVATDHRTYNFRADSYSSAKEWVKVLQKVIFRTRNEGDSVKITLPIGNIIDIEKSPMIDFAETFKIRVIESEESYAIDEYFFSFFGFGQEVYNTLKILIDNNPAQKLQEEDLRATGQKNRPDGIPRPSGESGTYSDMHSPKSQVLTTSILHDSVKATLSPVSSDRSSMTNPRKSGDLGRSASMEASRRSFDVSREPHTSSGRGRRSESTSRIIHSPRGRTEHSPWSPFTRKHGSSDSYVNSVEQKTESSAAIQSATDTQESASQILKRSDVFDSPTIQGKPRSAIYKDHMRGYSEESPRTESEPTGIRVIPPSRTNTQSDVHKTKQNPGNISYDIDEDTISESDQLPHSNSTPALQELVRAGRYPLQRASYLAGYLKSRSKRMSNLLATESMGYIEKVSGMWTGARKHYGDAEGVMPEDRLEDLEDEEEAAGHGDRFRAHFALPSTEKLQATYFAYLQRVLPLYGKIYISNRKLCFRSLLPGTRTKMILPLKDIETIDKEKGFRFGYSGLVIVIRGHEELFFEFSNVENRDDCAVTLLGQLETVRYMKESGLLSREEEDEAEVAKAEHKLLQDARKIIQDTHDFPLPTDLAESPTTSEAQTILFDDPQVSVLNFKPKESFRITCLTIGSRGDVQPYIAFCKGLIAEGHRPKIATHAEFGPWVKSHGIDFAPVAGDPAELMRICVENGMFTYSFLKEATSTFRGWLDGLMSSSWAACKDSDILIESPSAMAGIHIAEALEIPYFRAFTMPWTRTRAYPHAFAVPDHKMGGGYNYITYVMFDNVFWKAIAGQVNRWRKKELGLGSTSLDKLQPNKVPFLYNFSPSVVPPPLDWSDWIRVTGYWFLDEAANFTPPQELLDFIRRARTDKKKIVYIGFGSIVVSDPAAITRVVVESVLKADVRCILSKGWSDRLGKKDADKPEIPLPPEIHQIKSIPHDWLFKIIDAAAHHGGSGTTGASLRAGLPTIIYPFFGDQFFYGSRIEDLGVGVYVRKLNVSTFSRALWEATHNERIIVKAKVLGDQIRKENGVETAIQAIYRDLEYARSLIKKRDTNVSALNASATSGADGGSSTPDMVEGGDEEEESWTFVDDGSDLDIGRRISEAEAHEAMMVSRQQEEAAQKGIMAAFARTPRFGVGVGV
ncbi:MAG: Sterol 3-beta-glucosyltransferase [Cirrosporium novae-zelandiae]|nr:MAG: Sterol 3-beta-glucosyltransferase [Cirrosporium novae-zelandiae]KAI9736022.1 MAG: Sterol 3-beta-glucosyltransferase [Cirrosporium novae-zelandiae]